MANLTAAQIRGLPIKRDYYISKINEMREEVQTNLNNSGLVFSTARGGGQAASSPSSSNHDGVRAARNRGGRSGNTTSWTFQSGTSVIGSGSHATVGNLGAAKKPIIAQNIINLIKDRGRLWHRGRRIRYLKNYRTNHSRVKYSSSWDYTVFGYLPNIGATEQVQNFDDINPTGGYSSIGKGEIIYADKFITVINSLKSTIASRNNATFATVSYCHSSCHSSCHGSRGRR